jgi:hypothetical protein
VSTATELFWHALAHALVEPSYGFRLRFFLDAAVVLASGQALNWKEIAARLESAELPDATVAKRWLGAAAWLAGPPGGPAHLLGDVPAFDLTAALRWRLDVFRLLVGERFGAENGLWGMDLVARARRLFIDAGTRATLGLPLTPARPGSGLLRRAGRRTVVGAARLCFRAWRMLRRARAG